MPLLFASRCCFFLGSSSPRLFLGSEVSPGTPSKYLRRDAGILESEPIRWKSSSHFFLRLLLFWMLVCDKGGNDGMLAADLKEASCQSSSILASSFSEPSAHEIT